MEKFCSNCGNKLNDNADYCLNCGKKINKSTTNNYNSSKSKKKPIWIIIVAIIVVLGFIGIMFVSDDTNSNNDSSNKQENEVDKSAVLYKDNEFLVKITDYEYKSITDRIVVNFYIENNSNTETTFLIDGNVAIDGYMVDGGYLYEVIKANAKATKEISLYNLKDKNVIGKDAKEMRFDFNIYQSEKYMIKNRILDKKEMIYTFKK